MAVTTYTLTWAHGVTAGKVISWAVEHSEGDFATMEIITRNPRVPLLSGELWATFSRNGSPVFYGRLVGVPENLHQNTVRLLFLARPATYDADKAALAETLKADPLKYDPVWIAPDRRADPDVALEALPSHWHIDRVTHEVTVSDIIAGEDGTVVIDPNMIDRDSLDLTYGETPATSVSVKADLHWRQKANGEFSIMKPLVAAFKAARSYYNGCMTTYTGDGLVGSWPKMGQSFGGGWSVSYSELWHDLEASSVLPVRMRTGGFASDSQPPMTGGEWIPAHSGGINVVFDGDGDSAGGATYTSSGGQAYEITAEYTMFGLSWTRPNYYDAGPADRGGPSLVGFNRMALSGKLRIKFEADRERIETINFTLNADVQPLVAVSEDANLNIELSSSEVDQPIDPGGLMPIRDIRRNSYLITDRGIQSMNYLIMLARARLLARARAVNVSFVTTLDIGQTLTLRKSVTINDPRLPGDTATGKVIGLRLSGDGGSGRFQTEVTMACTIGRGNALSAPAEGTPDYVDIDYISDGYQAVPGSEFALTGDLYATTYIPTPLTEDDTNLFDMKAATTIQSLTVENGSLNQEATLLLGMPWTDTNEAIVELNKFPTLVKLEMKPVTGDALTTPFTPALTDLMIPKTIDLESVS